MLLQKLLENLELAVQIGEVTCIASRQTRGRGPTDDGQGTDCLDRATVSHSDVGYSQVAFYGPGGTRPLTCSVGTGTEVVGGWRQVTHENPSRPK